MNYIHYGHKNFNENLFTDIQNSSFGNKPIGGLWASPEDSEFGWKDWNESEQYAECNPDNAFRFTLTDGSRVLVIDSAIAAKNLPLARPSLFPGLGMDAYDWEKVARSYDAVLYLQTQAPELYHIMYGWDCDSILVLNPHVIKLLQN